APTHQVVSRRHDRKASRTRSATHIRRHGRSSACSPRAPRKYAAASHARDALRRSLTGRDPTDANGDDGRASSVVVLAYLVAFARICTPCVALPNIARLHEGEAKWPRLALKPVG